MKDFLIKHPIIAFLMLSEVCTMLTNVFTENRNTQSAAERAVDVLDATVNRVKSIKNEAHKEPIGFKV